MWQDFFGIFNNINKGLTGAFTALTTSPQSAPPPPQVKTSQDQELVAQALARIPKNVDPEIAQAFNNAEGEKKKLFGNLIADPYTYPNLSQSNKILFTQDVIKDLIRLQKSDQTNKDKDPINLIIDRISKAGNDSFISEYEAIVISDYYVKLDKATKEQIPVAIKTPPGFQCRRVANSRSNESPRGEVQGRRSDNASGPHPAIFSGSRRSENRTPAQLQKSKEMHGRIHQHIASKRESIHPAGKKPINNNITKSHSNQGLQTGIDAMNYVFKQGGVTTNYAQITGHDPRKNTDEAIAKKVNNEHKLTIEQLKRTREASKPLYNVGYHPEYGSRNPGRTKSLSNISTALKELEKENRDKSAKLAAINYTTQPSKLTRPSRVASASLDKTGKLPTTSPGQPLKVSRGTSLENRTGGGMPR